MSRTAASARPRWKAGTAPARTPILPPTAGLSDTMEKVDRAVARLEELQSLIRSGRPVNRSSPAPAARRLSAPAAPPPQLRKPPQPPTQRTSRIPTTTKPNRQPSPRKCTPSAARASSPPSACSSSAVPLRQQRRPPPHQPPLSRSLTAPKTNPQVSNTAASKLPKTNNQISNSASSKLPKTNNQISNSASSKLPKTFVIDTNSANSNPNRPWCLSSASSSTGQSKRSSIITTTTATTSSSNDYVYTSRSTTCTRRSTLSRRSQSLAAGPTRSSYGGNVQTHKELEIDPTEQEFGAEARPLLQGELQESRFRRRLSLPGAAAPPLKPARRFSLIPAKKRDSSPPELPLPALITRLPARRKVNNCNTNVDNNDEDDDAVDSPKPLPLPPSRVVRSTEFPLQPLPSVSSPARRRRQSISSGFSEKENRCTASCFPTDQLLHGLKSASARWSRRSSWSSALCHITNNNDDDSGGGHNLLAYSCLRFSAPRSPPPLSAPCSVPFGVKEHYKPWSVYKVDSPQPRELRSSCRRKPQLYMG